MWILDKSRFLIFSDRWCMLVTPVVVLVEASAISVKQNIWGAVATSQLASQLLRSNQLHKKKLFNQLFKCGFGDLNHMF